MREYTPRTFRRKYGWGWVSTSERDMVLKLKFLFLKNKEISEETGLSYTTVLNIIKSPKSYPQLTRALTK